LPRVFDIPAAEGEQIKIEIKPKGEPIKIITLPPPNPGPSDPVTTAVLGVSGDVIRVRGKVLHVVEGSEEIHFRAVWVGGKE